MKTKDIIWLSLAVALIFFLAGWLGSCKYYNRSIAPIVPPMLNIDSVNLAVKKKVDSANNKIKEYSKVIDSLSLYMDKAVRERDFYKAKSTLAKANIKHTINDTTAYQEVIINQDSAQSECDTLLIIAEAEITNQDSIIKAQSKLLTVDSATIVMLSNVATVSQNYGAEATQTIFNRDDKITRWQGAAVGSGMGAILGSVVFGVPGAAIGAVVGGVGGFVIAKRKKK